MFAETMRTAHGAVLGGVQKSDVGRVVQTQRSEAALLRHIEGKHVGSPEFVEAVRELRRHGYLQDPRDFTTILREYRQSQWWKDALFLLQEMTKCSVEASTITYNAVIATLGVSRAWGQALELSSKVQERNVFQDVVTCSSAISVCEKIGAWVCALELLEDLQADLEPNVIACNAAVSVCAKGGASDHAKRVLHSMTRMTVRRDTISFNAMLGAYERDGDWAQAICMVDDARDVGLVPDEISCNSAMNALASAASEWRWSLAMLARARCSSVELSVVTYTIAKTVCEQQTRWRFAFELLGRVKQHGIQIDVVALLVAAEWEHSLGFLKQMRLGGPQPTAITYNTVISACEKAHQCDRAIALLEDMRTDQIELTLYTCNAAVSAYQKGNYWEAGLAALRQLASSGLEGDAISFSSAVSACDWGSAWPWTVATLRDARSLKLASVEAFNAALSAFARMSRWTKVVMLFNAMHHHVRREAATYTTAASACVEPLAWRFCMVVIEDMLRAELLLDVMTTSCVARACGHGQSWQAASRLLLEGPSGGAPDSRGVLRSAVVWAYEAAGRDADCYSDASLPTTKEVDLLAYVRRNAPEGDIDAVIGCIESFAHQQSWLKIAGGAKARLLESCLRPGDRCVEFGTYIGYSTLLMVRHLRRLGGGGQVISCEVDALVAHVARRVLAWAGVEEVLVRVGCAHDWLSTGRFGRIDVLVLDHRAKRYHDDLRSADIHMPRDARVFADNVLSPGAPLFLEFIQQRYDAMVHDVMEFAYTPPLPDWVVICQPRATVLRTPYESSPLVRRLAAQVDAICLQSLRGRVDWHAFECFLGPQLRRWILSANRSTIRLPP